MAEKRKVVINLRHLMDFGKGPFNIFVMNSGKKVHTSLELLNEAGTLV
jgi:hypothetical protein